MVRINILGLFFGDLELIWMRFERDFEKSLIAYLRKRAIEATIMKGGKKLRQLAIHVLDLTKIEGKGEFSCPKCKVKISPEDTTERIYSLIEPKVRGDALQELVIQCNRCRSQIYLTGFALLNKLHI
jgi:hypothetical protein